MSRSPRPPEAYTAFVERFPKLGQAWDLVGEAGKNGPLDAKSARLIKLGIAMGALRQGAVHSCVRKALAEGVSRAEIEQVVALASGTLGFPATVAVFSWMRDMFDKADER